MIFPVIFLMIHKISCYKVKVSTGGAETRCLGGRFLMVYRTKAGRLGSGFINVCLKTRWLGYFLAVVGSHEFQCEHLLFIGRHNVGPSALHCVPEPLSD